MPVVDIAALGEDLFQNAACGLLQTSSDGSIQHVNKAFCRWIGLSAEDVVGRRRLQDLFTMGGRVFHQTHWAPLMQIQGSVAEVKIDVVHRDGQKVPMLFNAVRRMQDGVACDDIAAMVVTDRQKYERELLQARASAESAQAGLVHAHEKKDEFLATLAHELRNPLAPLRNAVEVLKLRELHDPTVAWARGVFDRQVRQLTRLVDDLLETSRITQGKLTLHRESFDLQRAVEDAIEAAMPFIEASRHTLHVQLPPTRLSLYADSARVTQMVLNLLNNAAKYTPDGGEIWLTVEYGQEVSISVRDTGVGISQDHLAGIFEMFSQVTPAVQRTEGGLGIGLALVKGLVELHGGTIRAESGGPGTGSEFKLTLPNDPGPQSEATPDEQPARETSRRRVLVVDDNEDARESMTALLQMQGHEVHWAADGIRAVAAAESFAPHVVLLDIGLPLLDGYGVARAIRAQSWGQSIRLIALTGWGQQQDKDAAQGVGFDHHLTKPVEIDGLLRLIGSVGTEGRVIIGGGRC